MMNLPELNFSIDNPVALENVAKSIIDSYPDQHILALTGGLGSGKTTFVKAFAKALGSEDEISSPTFSIVHQYGAGSSTIYHFDLYRIKNEDELFQIGFEEYLETKAYVLIEWPETAARFMPKTYLSVIFETENENKRKIICRIANT